MSGNERMRFKQSLKEGETLLMRSDIMQETWDTFSAQCIQGEYDRIFYFAVICSDNIFLFLLYYLVST